MNVYAYIDGFNLFYGALKGTPFKWLDLFKLCETFLPGSNIVKVKYFTAKVLPLGDPDRPFRQNIYLEALENFLGNKIEIIYGQFSSHPIKLPIALLQKHDHKNNISGQMIWTMKCEEKGSDVNIAVHLLNDAWHNLYDIAVLVSNDSDLALSLKIVRTQLNKKICLVKPVTVHSHCPELLNNADEFRSIRKNRLQSCQLPDKIPGTNLKKPSGW
jgi:uncharacterized LabA/DUF88 family protein